DRERDPEIDAGDDAEDEPDDGGDTRQERDPEDRVEAPEGEAKRRGPRRALAEVGACDRLEARAIRDRGRDEREDARGAERRQVPSVRRAAGRGRGVDE